MKLCSVSFVFCFIAFLSLPLSSIVNAQQGTDSCASPLPTLNNLSFDLTNLQCVDAWPLRSYVLRYARTGNNTWSFLLSTPDSSSYIGIGFSTNSRMIGSSAIVGWIPSDGTPGVVKQYLLRGQTPDQVMPDQGELPIVNNSLMIQSITSRLYMSFQLTVDLPRTSILYAMGPAGFFPTSPANRLREHRSTTTTSINYITGAQTVVKEAPYSTLRKTHGLMNMFGWGILIIIGVIVARHMKKWEPTWFYAHIAIQTTGFLLGLTGIICGLVLENRTKANVSTHKGLGITILVLGILQVMAMLARPHKDSKYRKYWNWYHHNIGRILIIIAISNIFYGIHLANAGSAWVGGYAFAVAALSLAAIALEIKKFLKK